MDIELRQIVEYQIMKDKYLILEQHKFNTFNDVWSVKYFNQTYDQAFKN